MIQRARQRRARFVVTVALVAAACGKSDKEQPPAAQTQATQLTSGVSETGAFVTPSSLASQTAAGDLRSATEAETALMRNGLRALARNKLEQAVSAESRRFEEQGEQLYKAQDYVGSVPLFEKAINIDPGNVNARYELARSFAVLGDVDAALELLTALHDFGCALCIERVLAAGAEAAFAPLHKDQRYIGLSKDLDARLLPLKAAGQRIVNWFMYSDHKTQPNEELIDPRALIVLDDKSKGAEARYRRLFGYEELREFIQKHFPLGVYPGSLDSCSNSCCSVKNAQVPAVHLKRFCFKMHGPGAVHLFKLEVEGDPSFSFPG